LATGAAGANNGGGAGTAGIFAVGTAAGSNGVAATASTVGGLIIFSTGKGGNGSAGAAPSGGGDFQVTLGQGGDATALTFAGAKGGSYTFTTGLGGASSLGVNAGDGGDFTITGSTGFNGGSIFFNPGAASGGAAGTVNLMSNAYQFTTTALTGAGLQLGTHAVPWNDVFANNHYALWQIIGDSASSTVLTMAATITPVVGMHHATGATPCDTIAATNLPATFTVGFIEFTVWADTQLTFITGGNITVGVVVPAGNSQRFIYDDDLHLWSPLL
jgi:hypothetical protein